MLRAQLHITCVGMGLTPVPPPARRYADAALTAARRANSQLASLSAEYSVEELRAELRAVVDAATPVQTRAEDLSLQTLRAIIRELKQCATLICPAPLSPSIPVPDSSADMPCECAGCPSFATAWSLRSGTS